MKTQRLPLLAWTGLLATLLAAYWNHFENGFHFDDIHAIVDNPAIRTLANLPRFFWDVTTFSHDPTSQSYRPLVTSAVALDYWLGGGLDPFWFHLSTFLWLLVQITVMYALFMHVLRRTSASPHNAWIAWFAAAVYGLHPASAQTVNYIIQRGDLYVAVGMVAGIVIYASRPAWRRYGLYLVPPLAAMFAKPTGVIFPLLLLVYVVLMDRGATAARPRKPIIASVLHPIVAFLLAAGFLLLEKRVTPPTFFHTTISSFDYWITQPYVTLRYFRSFFWPLYLNMDTDLRAFHALGSAPVLAGFGFCFVLIALAVFTARRREWLPVSFGLWWFLISLLPTAVYPLNEVENDHRMFLPFIGLSLAVVWTAARVLRVCAEGPTARLASAALLILAALAFGTYQRNRIWLTEESLWRDDIEKCPNNARGHYALGVALAKTPDQVAQAIAEYKRALEIRPDYVEARANLGAALSNLPGRLPEAVSEYEAGLRLSPHSAELHNNLGVALAKIPGGLPESISHFETALRIRPHFPQARDGLADAHIALGAALSSVPGQLPEAIAHYETALRINPNSAEAHSDLGAALSTVPGRLPEAIMQYETALRINPGLMEAHYNLGLLLSSLPGRLPEALSHFEAALHIQPSVAVQQKLDQLRAAGANRNGQFAR